MNVKVINIAPEYQNILLFLYPTYTWTDSKFVMSNFITVRDINSKSERDMADYYYSNAILVSSRIFDEVWDEDKIKEECLKFMREKFHTRKRTIKTLATKGPEFIEEIIQVMFTERSFEENQESIMELFSKFGSATFNEAYFRLCSELSVPQVRASMFTFISKICSDTESIFYKKKQLILLPKIRANFSRAFQAYQYREKDLYGLSFLKFLNDLVVDPRK